MIKKKLFVGGLGDDMDSNKLLKVFSEYGEVEEAKVIRDRDSGESRGFGFVTMADAVGAVIAHDWGDGEEIGESTLNIEVARSRR